jgi:hypothetical protein
MQVDRGRRDRTRTSTTSGADDLIRVPNGTTLEIRASVSDDAIALRQFYAKLSDDDRRRRFFTSYQPGAEWCHDWVTLDERRGFVVIAITHPTGEPKGGPGRIVGDAGYAMRADGDGDLAIVVAPEWRGWLGPYLLDVVVAHAKQAGVANLQADVLTENSVMISMLRHRGAVAMGHDLGVVRLSIATDGFVPSWPPLDERPRLLVEVPGGRWTAASSAEDAGFDVMMCSGPSRRRGGCPVLQGEPCPLAGDADAIVVLLGPDDSDRDRLIRAHHERDPETPIFVRAGGPGAEFATELSGDGDDIGQIAGAIRLPGDGVRRPDR